MNKRNFTIIVIVLLIWNVVLTALLIRNREAKTTITEENVYGISTDLTKVAQEGYSSVVSVKSSYGKQSGFIYKQNDNIAYIVTTYHGIEKDNVVSVSFANGKTVMATVIGFDYLNDVAVLSIDSEYQLNIVKCGDNEYTKNGEFIVNIGASTNEEKINDVQLGIVSNNLICIDDSITYQRKNYRVQKEMIGLSLNADKGNSGSPIFNMKNEVIGMIQEEDDSRVYSLTINEIKMIADKIINNETYNKINIGIKGQYIKNMEAYDRNILNVPFEIVNGFYVSDVLPNSLASKLSIQPADIIVSINNNQINGQKDYLNSLYLKDEQELSIIVNRSGKRIELQGTISD